MTDYRIVFYEHLTDDKIENFLNRLREDGISVAKGDNRIYTLSADRSGTEERLRFYIHQSAYKKLFELESK